MEVFSHYGVGIKVFAIERRPNGRVEFTLWATVFFLPVWPLSSWSAVYAGPVRPDGIKEDGHRFDNPVRIQRDFMSFTRTLTKAALVLVVAIAPITYFIFNTSSEGGTVMEMVLVFAACAWPVVVVTLIEHRRRKLLLEKWS